MQEEGRRPFVIGVAGGTASGKTSVCRKIMEAVCQEGVNPKVVMISQDSFYRDLSQEQRERASRNQYNFDHPDALDIDLLKKTLREIVAGRTVDIPVYDFKTHTRSKTERRVIQPSEVILVEGILILYDPEIREMLQMKLFVDTDSDTRLARRVLRDIQERGRTLESVLDQYTVFVKPAFEEFTLPTKKYADVIIPRGAENDVAINLIIQHIKDIISGKLKLEDMTGSRGGLSFPARKRHVSESSAIPLARPH
ncbi:PREDICTED: uridine-cytidine kinase 2-like [Amphimedon queenslandica]|uniref:Uridine kinase n=1 Tax=Amphimedon queenslandica TaxID=400682 RepID=A0A1X7U0B7_AMPQE|nr:PREDICTED: uridine-cytidine kinase 2-like [Amphimedon queenslandica]|eukprot:XP_011406314.1 PREDICTED: uridine-cytidine kinase 2-like [Amphimedon queenslandica]